MKNIKKKMLIASFFSAIMLTMPFTAVTGSVDDTANSTPESTYALIDLTEEEISLLKEIIDRISDGEMGLSKEEINILEGAVNKLDDKLELNEFEIRLIRGVLCRIFVGEMELDEDEIIILGDVLNKIADTEIKLSEEIGFTSSAPGEPVNGYDHEIILTASQISRFVDFINSLDDETVRAIVEYIVDQLITEDGKLDLTIFGDIISGNYRPGSIIKKTLDWILTKLLDLVLSIIMDDLYNYYTHGRSGWIETSGDFFFNVTTIIYDVWDYWDDIKDDIEAWLNAIEAFIDLWKNPDLENLIDFISALTDIDAKIKDILTRLWELPGVVQENFTLLIEEWNEFIFWFAPDLVDSDNYSIDDRAYNQPIIINVEVIGHDPSDLRIDCDGNNHYVNSTTGVFDPIIYTTVDENKPYGDHQFGFHVYRLSTGQKRVSIWDHGYSTAEINITVDFTGKPITPYGPMGGKVLEWPPRKYYTYAIDPNGGDFIYYQWDWDESSPFNGLSDWSKAMQSGYLYANGTLHLWLTKGLHEVKVRAGDTADGSGWVGPWSESLQVYVDGLFENDALYGFEALFESSNVEILESVVSSQTTTTESTNSETTGQSSSQSN